MGTRALIGVKGFGVHIYQHYDGYPDYVKPYLIPIVKDFVDARGNDPMYFTYQLARKIGYMELFGTSIDFSKYDDMDTFIKQTNLGNVFWGIGEGKVEDLIDKGYVDYIYIIDLENRKIEIYLFKKLEQKFSF